MVLKKPGKSLDTLEQAKLENERYAAHCQAIGFIIATMLAGGHDIRDVHQAIAEYFGYTNADTVEG